MTTAKVLKSLPRPGFEPMTTWKIFLHDPDSNLEKMQNHVRPGFELVTSRKMARRAPGLPYRWRVPRVFHECLWADPTLLYKPQGSDVFHECSTSVPRVFHESPPNTRGTSWSVVSRGTPVEHRGPGTPRSVGPTQLAPIFVVSLFSRRRPRRSRGAPAVPTAPPDTWVVSHASSRASESAAARAAQV